MAEQFVSVNALETGGAPEAAERSIVAQSGRRPRGVEKSQLNAENVEFVEYCKC